jgi:phospholipase/carboxylesterase
MASADWPSARRAAALSWAGARPGDVRVAEGPDLTLEDAAVDDLTTLTPPLLVALERLGFIARYFNPPDFAQLLAAVGEPEGALREGRARLDAWPAQTARVREPFAAAIDATLAAYDGLRAATEAEEPLGAVFRALGQAPTAQEALYALSDLPPVSRFFLEPDRRQDADLAQRLTEATDRADTGVIHLDDAPGLRGGASIYVPEYYDPDVRWPVVFALHGGSGNGRSFLWSWLRAARTHGAILVAPTAVGRTWALSGADADTPNLARILALVGARWNIDRERLLLSGMSDGGTFSYVSGLEPGSPFTHLAPTSAAFHPMMAQFADRDRIAGLPIFITHGALDWMFPVEMARGAEQALRRAGADVTYREVADLAHTFPRELNSEVLAWLRGD